MRKRVQSAVLVLTLLVVIIECSYGVKATSVQDLKDKQQQISGEESKLEQAKKNLEGKLQDLNSSMVVLSNSISALEDDIADGEKKIEETQKALEKAEALSQKQYEEMKLRIQYMYENRVTNWLDVYMSSDGMADFLNQIDYISELSNYDREQLTKYQQTQEEIAADKVSLEKHQKKLISDQKKLKGKQKELLANISDVKANISETEQDIAKQKERRKQLAGKIKAMEEYERMLEEKRAREEAERIAREKEEAGKANQSGGSGDQGQAGNSDSDKSLGQGKPTKATASEKDLLAALIYCEAGGASYEGQLAVGSVVINRMRSSRFPNTMTGVIYQSGQFSPARSGKLALTLENNLANANCHKAAESVLAGNVTGDWLFFAFAGKIKGTVIGNVVFY